MTSSKQRRDRSVLEWMCSVAVVVAAYSFATAQPQRAAAEQPANYARPCERRSSRRCCRCRSGRWNRRAGCDWAVAARDGITGHLDRVPSRLSRRLEGHARPMDRANPDGTGWPLEQCAYWLDGAIRLGYILHDEPLIRKIRARLDPIVDGVNKADFGTTLDLLEKRLQAARVRQLGAFADGPCADGGLPGHRRTTRARRAGEGLCRLSGRAWATSRSSMSAACAISMR